MTTWPSSRRRGSRPRAGDVRLCPPFEPVPVLALDGPGELIDSVPYLLGFHPRDSLVLVGLGSSPSGRDRVGLSARVDLADLVVDPAIVGRCTAALARSGAHSAVVLMYDQEAAAGMAERLAADDAAVQYPAIGEPAFGDPRRVAMPWRAVVDEICLALQDAQLIVRDALLVGEDRWRSYLCADPDCCPADGSPRPGLGSRAAATATYVGLSALSGREALEQLLAPPAPEVLEPMATLIEAAEGREFAAVLAGRQAPHRRAEIRALFAAARAEGLPADGRPIGAAPLTGEQVARFGVALGDTAVRDACWLAFEGGRIPPSGLWRTLAGQLPSPYDAQPLFLLGWQEWRAGNGALAGIAGARAARSDPGCSAADLLLDALAQGLDPRSTPRLRADPTGPALDA